MIIHRLFHWWTGHWHGKSRIVDVLGCSGSGKVEQYVEICCHCGKKVVKHETLK